jgi:hypothetical protein
MACWLLSGLDRVVLRSIASKRSHDLDFLRKTRALGDDGPKW